MADNSEAQPQKDSPSPSRLNQSGSSSPRRRKRRARDTNAPQRPVNAFLRFQQERRGLLSQQHPTMQFTEITKVIASEWAALETNGRQKYVEAAEQDRQRYSQEMEKYHQTDAYKMFMDKKREAKKKPVEKERDTARKERPVSPQPGPSNIMKTSSESSNTTIPIFTEDFLTHNRERENELRQLRKTSTELEEQNAILTKHIDNMKVAIEKLQRERGEQEEHNSRALEHYNHLKKCLLESFSSLHLPGMKEGPTSDGLEDFLLTLTNLATNSADDPLIQAARDIIGKITLPT